MATRPRTVDLAITPGGRIGDASPLAKHPGGPRKLTDYTREIAHALMRKGMPEGRAIAIARASQSRWSRGGGKVRPQVRAAAAKSTVEQHALDHVKSFAVADVGDVALAGSGTTIGVTMTTMHGEPKPMTKPTKRKGKPFGGRKAAPFAKGGGRAKMIAKAKAVAAANDADADDRKMSSDGAADVVLGKDGSKWKHDYIPLNPVAVAMKMHKHKGGGVSSTKRAKAERAAKGIVAKAAPTAGGHAAHLDAIRSEAAKFHGGQSTDRGRALIAAEDKAHAAGVDPNHVAQAGELGRADAFRGHSIARLEAARHDPAQRYMAEAELARRRGDNPDPVNPSAGTVAEAAKAAKAEPKAPSASTSGLTAADEKAIAEARTKPFSSFHKDYRTTDAAGNRQVLVSTSRGTTLIHHSKAPERNGKRATRGSMGERITSGTGGTVEGTPTTDLPSGYRISHDSSMGYSLKHNGVQIRTSSERAGLVTAAHAHHAERTRPLTPEEQMTRGPVAMGDNGPRFATPVDKPNKVYRPSQMGSSTNAVTYHRGDSARVGTLSLNKADGKVYAEDSQGRTIGGFNTHAEAMQAMVSAHNKHLADAQAKTEAVKAQEAIRAESTKSYLQQRQEAAAARVAEEHRKSVAGMQRDINSSLAEAKRMRTPDKPTVTKSDSTRMQAARAELSKRLDGSNATDLTGSHSVKAGDLKAGQAVKFRIHNGTGNASEVRTGSVVHAHSGAVHVTSVDPATGKIELHTAMTYRGSKVGDFTKDNPTPKDLLEKEHGRGLFKGSIGHEKLKPISEIMREADARSAARRKAAAK